MNYGMNIVRYEVFSVNNYTTTNKTFKKLASYEWLWRPEFCKWKTGRPETLTQTNNLILLLITKMWYTITRGWPYATFAIQWPIFIKTDMIIWSPVPSGRWTWWLDLTFKNLLVLLHHGYSKNSCGERDFDQDCYFALLLMLAHRNFNDSVLEGDFAHPASFKNDKSNE